MFASLAFMALLIEAAAGYPQWLFRAFGHPVTWIGWLLAWCERRWNRSDLTFAERRTNGIAALLLTLAVTFAASGAAVFFTGALPGVIGLLLSALLASTLLAQRSLAEHVGAVADALENKGLSAGRDAVSRIVGRDKNTLDEAGVSRAAVESSG